MAKASDENGSDGQGRKLGEQTGLDRFFAKKSSKSMQCCIFDTAERWLTFALFLLWNCCFVCTFMREKS